MTRTGRTKQIHRISILTLSAAFLLFAAMLFYLLPVPAAYADADTAPADGAVLRIGYTGSDGITVDQDGMHSGYIVAYLEEIAQYTDWEYEYVYDTWENNLENLEQGKIDLLVMTYFTEQRGKRFLFSDLAMAHDYTALYAAADSNIYYQDYEAFDGCRVGITAGSIFEDTVPVYEEEENLDFEIVPYATEEAAVNALLQGKIEMVAASGFSEHMGVKLVDRFQLEPVYFASSKQNQELMDELNSATQKALIYNRQLEASLMQDYYSASVERTNLYLTREEQAYLDSAEPILIKGFDDRKPMGYTDANGNFVGILPDFLNELGEMCGVEFIYDTTEHMSLEENATAMAAEDYGLLFMDRPLEKLGLDTTLYKSDALFQIALAYVKRNGDRVGKWDRHTFSVNSEMHYVGELLLKTNSQSTVLYFDTSQECMEALADGEAEMAILEEHVAAYLLQKPKYADNLQRVPGSGAYADGMCLYVTEKHKPLISILNKALEHLDKEQRQYMISNSLLSHAYEYKIGDMLYKYGFLMAAVAVILALGAILYIRIIRLKIQKKENEILQEKIQLDELTGVYHRMAFFEKASEQLKAGGEGMCIVRLNICHFKVINELYGAAKGDRLLKDIGTHLKNMSRQKHFIVGRFTADHFYLCIEHETFLRAGFAKRTPVSWLGMDIMLTYGIYPVDARQDTPVSAMCDRADMAIPSDGQMTSKYIYYYNDASRQKMLHQQEIENEMEQALAEKQFCIYIQPKYDVETERVLGGEALVRWNHPQKGMIPPGDFIELFERNGFILKLDHYVWEESCRFLAEMKAKGLPVHPLSVNVSRAHFYGTELQDKLLALLTKYGLEPENLELEITESICSQEPEVIFNKCDTLRKLGFRIAMDDFGSGYSSLNMLKRMPLDIIKMDLKFLSEDSDAVQEQKGRSILYALIELARTLEIQIVVEGLETEEQKNFIRGIGDCAVQGYYFSKPVPCRNYENMITETLEF